MNRVADLKDMLLYTPDGHSYAKRHGFVVKRKAQIYPRTERAESSRPSRAHFNLVRLIQSALCIVGPVGIAPAAAQFQFADRLQQSSAAA